MEGNEWTLLLTASLASHWHPGGPNRWPACAAYRDYYYYVHATVSESVRVIAVIDLAAFKC